MKKSISSIILSLGLALSVQTIFAQATTTNPDASPTPNNGPIRVLNEPPRGSQQTDPNAPKSLKDRLRLGGAFGLSLGTITNIEVSPIVALQVTPQLTTGAGIIYQYYASNWLGAKYNESIFGGRGFAMYNVFNGINAHAEYETMNRKYYDYISSVYRPTWIGSFLVGGTYSQPTGGRFIKAINLSVLYNMNYSTQINPTNPLDNISPYNSPLIIRASFF